MNGPACGKSATPPAHPVREVSRTKRRSCRSAPPAKRCALGRGLYRVSPLNAEYGVRHGLAPSRGGPS
jgi:hypothetical protein